MKETAILLVVYNQKDNLEDLYISLSKQSYQDFCIYFVDNNSSDGSVNFSQDINEKLELDIKYILLKENTGFAKGNNIAALKAVEDGCRFLFILNNDMELDIKCLEELIKLLNSNERIAAVGPVMFYWGENKGKNKIQFYGANIDFKRFLVKEKYSGKIFEDPATMIPETLLTQHLPGGAMLLKTEIYKKIGLWDERFFMYNDEIDLSRRLLEAGYSLAVTSKSKVWHKHKVLNRKKIAYYLEYYMIARNKYLYFHKYKMYCWMVYGFIIDLIKLPWRWLWFIKICDVKLGYYYSRGIFSGLLQHSGKPSLIKN